MNYLEEILKSGLVINTRYLDRYVSFIDFRIDRVSLVGYKEKHHILPKSLFPDFKKNKDNIIELTLREHYLVHWMLAKIFGGSQWYAFNQMKRYGGSSILYQYGREHLSKLISKLNKGRKVSPENRLRMSEITKNTVMVRDKNGDCFRVNKADPRYVSGELKFYRFGLKHTEFTKKLMSDSGIKGKQAYLVDGKAKFYFEQNDDVSGLTKYKMSNDQKNMISDHVKSLIWVTLSDGTYKRIKSELFDETTHRRGRVGFRGFAHINDQKRNNKSNK